MRCYQFLQSLRKAVGSGALTAVGLLSTVGAQAAVVGPELPPWMTSPVIVKVDVCPTYVDQSAREPLPWFVPAEGCEPYGDHYVEFECRQFDAAEIETPLIDRLSQSEIDPSAGSSSEFRYDDGYRYGYDYHEPQTQDAASSDSDVDAMSDYGRSDYYVDEGPEAASAHQAEMMEVQNESSPADQWAENYSPYSYEHRYPTDDGQSPPASESNQCESDYGPETAEPSSDTIDYDYSYRFGFPYEKYGRWHGPTSEIHSQGGDTRATDEAETAADETSTHHEENATFADEHCTDTLTEEAAIEEYRGHYMPTSETANEDESEDAAEGDTAHSESSDEPTTDDGSFCPYQGEMTDPTPTAEDSFDPYRDHKAFEQWSAEEVSDMSSSEAAETPTTDESAGESGNGTAGYAGSHVSMVNDGWRPLSGEPFTTDSDGTEPNWIPDNLLSDSDCRLIRDLSLAYEEPLDVRANMLNDYIETLGWEALKLVERFEDSSGIHFLGLTEDLSGLAAVLAVFRATQQGAMSLDQAVDTLCHGFDRLDGRWSETVARLCTEEDQSHWVSTEQPADENWAEPTDPSAAAAGRTQIELSDKTDQVGSTRSRLDWLLQESVHWTVAIRNTLKQFGNIDLGGILGRTIDYDPSIGSQYTVPTSVTAYPDENVLPCEEHSSTCWEHDEYDD